MPCRLRASSGPSRGLKLTVTTLKSLPRVSSISKSASLKANGADDMGPGSQLIGNPAYGQWRTNSDGMSFWEWYGAYSLFTNIFDIDRRHYQYRYWSSKRNYSYYHDVGRRYYSSPKTLKKQFSVEQKAKAAAPGRAQFRSAYARPKTGSSGLSHASKQAMSGNRQFNSSFGRAVSSGRSFASTRASSPSKQLGGSFRSGSSRTGRGIGRGGK